MRCRRRRSLTNRYAPSAPFQLFLFSSLGICGWTECVVAEWLCVCRAVCRVGRVVYSHVSSRRHATPNADARIRRSPSLHINMGLHEKYAPLLPSTAFAFLSPSPHLRLHLSLTRHVEARGRERILQRDDPQLPQGGPVDQYHLPCL